MLRTADDFALGFTSHPWVSGATPIPLIRLLMWKAELDKVSVDCTQSLSSSRRLIGCQLARLDIAGIIEMNRHAKL